MADDLSSAAEVLMGESDEGTPMVLVRGLKRSLLKKTEYPSSRFAIPSEEDVFFRSIGYGGTSGRGPNTPLSAQRERVRR